MGYSQDLELRGAHTVAGEKSKDFLALQPEGVSWKVEVLSVCKGILVRQLSCPIDCDGRSWFIIKNREEWPVWLGIEVWELRRGNGQWLQKQALHYLMVSLYLWILWKSIKYH